MAVMFFGQYLVEKGIVSRESLLKAIALQESVNLSVGAMAVAIGLLTEEEVERVNQLQRSEDLRFGDLAVRLGMLTAEQLQQLLTRQKRDHLYIGEALVRVGGLDEAELMRYLADFRAHQALYATDRVEIPAGVPTPAAWEIFADLTYKMLTRVAHLTFHPEPCRVIRELESFHVVAALDFHGDLNGTYLFAVSAAARLKIARAILNEERVEHEERELLDDTVQEFVNVVCGNIAAKLAQQGKAIEITPPRLIPGDHGVSVPAGRTGLLFPVSLSYGDTAALAVFIG